MKMYKICKNMTRFLAATFTIICRFIWNYGHAAVELPAGVCVCTCVSMCLRVFQ